MAEGAMTAFPVPGYRKLPVVYYLQRQDQAIKIGWSACLIERKRILEKTHGPLELLIWEPGDLAYERSRHDEFGDLRIDRNREWFRPGLPLVEYVGLVREALLEWTADVGEEYVRSRLA